MQSGVGVQSWPWLPSAPPPPPLQPQPPPFTHPSQPGSWPWLPLPPPHPPLSNPSPPLHPPKPAKHIAVAAFAASAPSTELVLSGCITMMVAALSALTMRRWDGKKVWPVRVYSSRCRSLRRSETIYRGGGGGEGGTGASGWVNFVLFGMHVCVCVCVFMRVCV